MQLLNAKDIRKSPARLPYCGGKGRSLIELLDFGYNVPPFLILTSDQVDRWLEPLRLDISELLAGIETATDETVIKVADQISRLILAQAWPSNSASSLIKQCLDCFGENRLVSIRSSALKEDGSKHSFAGQLDSFLYVPQNKMLEYIKVCTASLYSARSIKYRLNQGLNLNDSMAVIVQQMLDVEKSGVLFTMNIAGNMNESVIAAAYGVGEGVVSDRADTDMYYIERHTNRVLAVTATKTVRMDRDPDTPGHTMESSVAQELQKSPVLSEQQALTIAAIGLELEAQFGCAQDVEFALTADGDIYILQSRPVTAIKADELRILDNSNIVESYPDITLPLSVDFARQAYHGVFLGAARAFKVSEAFIQAEGERFDNLLSRVNGRVYYQLHNARKIMEQVLVSRGSQIAWREFIGLSGLDWPIVKPSVGRRMRSLAILVSLLLSHKKNMRRLFRIFDTTYHGIRHFIADMDSKSATEIFTFYEQQSTALFTEWAPTIVNDYFAMKYQELYHNKIKKMKLSVEDNVANDLLCGIEGMESEQPIIELLRMKQIIKNSSELTRVFEGDPETVWKKLSSLRPASGKSGKGENRDFNEFFAVWNNYLELYEDRVLEELKLETPGLKRRPWALVSMIQNQLASDTDLDGFRARQKKIRRCAEDMINQKLKFKPLRKRLFNFLLKQARCAVKERENMRLNRARMYGAVKSMFLELGRRMCEDGLVDSQDDIFYLELNDLRNYAVKKAREPLQEKVSVEKSSIDRYSNMNMPDRLFYQGELPDLSYYRCVQSSESVSTRLKGIGVSKGTVRAKARVVQTPSMELKVENEILVTRMTDPGWVFLLAQSAGTISEKGSLLSHTAIIGREFGIPTVVGVPQATTLIKSGDFLELNGDLGEVTILQRQKSGRDVHLVESESA